MPGARGEGAAREYVVGKIAVMKTVNTKRAQSFPQDVRRWKMMVTGGMTTVLSVVGLVSCGGGGQRRRRGLHGICMSVAMMCMCVDVFFSLCR